MRLALHWQILVGLVCGTLLGFAARTFAFPPPLVDGIAVLGTVFLRALRMIIVPLIVSSLISGITSISSAGDFGRLGAKTAVYYVSTSLLAILTGLAMVNLVRPGAGVDLGFEAVPEDLAANVDKIGDTLLGIVPTNPFAAMVNGDMLPIIFFSLLFGFFITRVGEPHRQTLQAFFNAVFAVMMRMTRFIIRFTPIGVLSLIMQLVARTGFDVFPPMASYMITVAAGLVIHALVTLPLLQSVIGRVDPMAQFRTMSVPLLTAFSTASSSATLPLTMHAVESNAGVSNRVTSFVLPLGATINMDGTALYECVAAMFIAQVYGIELSLFQQFLVVLTALLASIGAAGVPMAGLVMITIILRAVGLPLEGVGLILAVNRILDMLRTSVNVWSDSSGAVIIARTEGETELSVLRSARRSP